MSCSDTQIKINIEIFLLRRLKCLEAEFAIYHTSSQPVNIRLSCIPGLGQLHISPVF